MFGFGKGKLKEGHYVFVVKRMQDYNDIIIGKIIEITNSNIKVRGTRVHPIGLIHRIRSGGASGRPRHVITDPTPDNCIFLLIDRIETMYFDDSIYEKTDNVRVINENRFFVLDGWIRENLPDMFADVFYSSSEDERQQYRSALIEKMNSIYDRDLKDHLYAVLRSTNIL